MTCTAVYYVITFTTREKVITIIAVDGVIIPLTIECIITITPVDGVITFGAKDFKFGRFKENLRYAKEETGRTWEELSSMTDISAETLSRYASERNHTMPALDNAWAIASSLGVSLSWLTDGSSQADMFDYTPRNPLSDENRECFLDAHKFTVDTFEDAHVTPDWDNGSGQAFRILHTLFDIMVESKKSGEEITTEELNKKVMRILMHG